MNTPVKIFLFVLLCYYRGLWGQGTKSPEAFLGYELGSRFTYHHQTVSYFEYVAERSDKTRLITYGKTYENRPLIACFISSAQNLEKLSEIGKNNRIRAGLEAGRVSGISVPVVWLGYNIHGDEAVSTEVAMQFLYEVLSLPSAYLDSLLIVIDPCLNPDGRERYTQWYSRMTGKYPNAHPLAWEHFQPWPGGRFNHYGIDLNRDWVWQTQTESASRMALYRQYMPQVHCDFHEMGHEFSYYFAPAAQPYHEQIHPWHQEFQDSLGNYNARIFDGKQWLYFTKEIYDLLYPGYGETYPILQGATGFTFEQGGGGKAGIAIQTTDRDTLTLKERIAHHLAVSHSVVQTSFRLKNRLLREFEDYFQKAAQNPAGQYKTYVIKAENTPDRLQNFLELLDKQQIRYGRVANTIKTSGYAYHTLQTEPLEVTAEDIIISAYQPLSGLLKALLEPQTAIRDSQTYDLTAWTLPYAFGLKSFAITQKILPTLPYSKSYPDTVKAIKPVYAFAVRWQDVGSAKLLAALLQQGVRVRYAEKPFNAENTYFGAGSLLITAHDNKHIALFEQIVAEAIQKYYVKYSILYSGLVQNGKDVGSRFSRMIQMPKIALLAGEHLSPPNIGEIWHFFDHDLGYPITILENSFWNYYTLDDFDVLILPSGNYNRLKLENKIIDFVERGGRVIAIENAISLLAKKDNKLSLSVKEVNYQPDSLPVFGKMVSERQSNYISGAICQVLIDTTHPLGFGLPRPYFTLKNTETYYQYLEKSGFNVGIYPKNTVVNGFAGFRAKKEIPHTLAIGIENYGKGSVVYLADNPLIRSFWYAGKLLFVNALVFGYNTRYHPTDGEKQ